MPGLQQNPWLRILLMAIGLVSLILAVILAWSQMNWQAIEQVRWHILAVMAMLVVINQMLAVTMFWVVTRSFDTKPPVRWVNMLDLLCASAVVNYLPLRPGLLARAAYLKIYHQLPWIQSAQSLGIIASMSLLLSLGAFGVVMLSGEGIRWAVAIGCVCFIMTVSGSLAKCLFGRPMFGAWSWVLIKLADLLVTAGRLWLAFGVVGAPIGWDMAIACGGAGMIVSMLGFTPNGLGIREWAVGISAMGLTPTIGTAGLAAAVLDRAIEAMVLLPWGGWSIARLSRQSVHLTRLRVI